MSSSWTDWTDVLLNTRYSVADTAAESGRRSQRQRVKEVTVVHTTPRARRLAAPFAVVVSLLVLGAGSAHASLLVADGENCGQYTSSQVFLPWADPANYTLSPGGDFENANGQWALAGASRVAGDNEPFQVGGANDHSSLSLPSGSVAVSQPLCVGLAEPTLRLFVKQVSGPALAGLRVEALFDDATGETQSLRIGTLGAGSGWTLSPQMAIVANLLPLLDEGTPVAFRFTPLGGSFRIDDVYVDPYRHG
jgi:hypothetical protein